MLRLLVTFWGLEMLYMPWSQRVMRLSLSKIVESRILDLRQSWWGLLKVVILGNYATISWAWNSISLSFNLEFLSALSLWFLASSLWWLYFIWTWYCDLAVNELILRGHWVFEEFTLEIRMKLLQLFFLLLYDKIPLCYLFLELLLPRTTFLVKTHAKLIHWQQVIEVFRTNCLGRAEVPIIKNTSHSWRTCKLKTSVLLFQGFGFLLFFHCLLLDLNASRYFRLNCAVSGWALANSCLVLSPRLHNIYRLLDDCLFLKLVDIFLGDTFFVLQCLEFSFKIFFSPLILFSSFLSV